ncbi:restriction endonuclease subunit S [Photobacterium leiognathi]|uniref:restriction endonuclease subunit S n=1 Tax=Photobacterium leiognathi TaxID=553611 RepID=UPI002981B1D3|nr:restriction endonuclease subunit S [Photobacterium leiognathi]
MSKLPKGWKYQELKNIADVVSGNAFKSKDFVENGIPVVKISNVQSNKYIEKNQEYLPYSFNCETNAKYLVNPGDLLIALTRPVVSNKLKVCIYPNKQSNGLLNQRVARIDINKSFCKPYLIYFLNSKLFRDAVQDNMSETLQPNLSPKALSEISIICPPLNEQKRIVEKLDEVLAQVDTIKARLDGIPAILKRFRQSVLAAAVSGKLTEEWRGNSDYKKHDLCDDWQWGAVPFEWTVKFYPELVESRLGKMLDKSKNEGNPTKYLGNINVRWFDTNLSNVQEILVSDKEQKELALSVGDVLICEGGEPGRCCIWNKNLEEVIIFQKALHRARVKKEIIPEWLTYNLKRDADGLILNQLFTGTTIKHLTGKALKNYPLRVPPQEEQKEIVRLVDQYFAFADTIEAQVKKAQTRVDNLTQSILAKAFRGELVPQDPNDEPADKLLERIAVARKEAEALAKAAKKAAPKKRTTKAKSTA